MHLPLHMARSKTTTYEASEPHRCMGLYRTVLHESPARRLPLRSPDLGSALLRCCAPSSSPTVHTGPKDASSPLA
ncbi:hypothetical protein [Streptomyces sp. NPDC101149]|uniref:hypothetical protein n=1 Tax=Streptomyces sp. NPDC101149 TaxID=3366113 RepID=UPI003826E0B9